MISIDKPSQPPAILRKRGRTTTATNCADFNRDTAAYLNGDKIFTFKSDIYGAKSVKNALVKAQHRKCCFCESKVDHIAYGDVEHFRPKGGYRQKQKDALGRPGYYWLAYAWNNLFFSCQICNQRFKGNLYPLKDPHKRARSHLDEIALEEPLFVDPGNTDPEAFIRFRDEYPFAVNGNAVGKTTIEALGLDREMLNERRRDRLAMLKLLKFLADSLGPESEDARALLERAIQPDAEFSAMAKAALI